MEGVLGFRGARADIVRGGRSGCMVAGVCDVEV